MNCKIKIYETAEDDHITVHMDEDDAFDMAFCLQCSPAVNRFMVFVDDEHVSEFEDAFTVPKMVKKESKI